MSFHSGTSNLIVPLKRADYPPEFKNASRLSYYASQFSSIEINATFYKLPRLCTREKWAQMVPDDFRFTFKVPRCVTHAKDFYFETKELELFTDVVAGVGDKKGCLLVQLPPKVGIDKEEELTGVLESLSENAKGWRIAVEFRNRSWYDSSVYRLLEYYQAGMVEHDIPKSATPKIQARANFVYLRLHGPEGTYRGSYDEAVLDAHANRITAWIKEGKQVYVYFNNTMGSAIENLQTLNTMVKAKLQEV